MKYSESSDETLKSELRTDDPPKKNNNSSDDFHQWVGSRVLLRWHPSFLLGSTLSFSFAPTLPPSLLNHLPIPYKLLHWWPLFLLKLFSFMSTSTLLPPLDLYPQLLLEKKNLSIFWILSTVLVVLIILPRLGSLRGFSALFVLGHFTFSIFSLEATLLLANFASPLS